MKHCKYRCLLLLYHLLNAQIITHKAEGDHRYVREVSSWGGFCKLLGVARESDLPYSFAVSSFCAVLFLFAVCNRYGMGDWPRCAKENVKILFFSFKCSVYRRVSQPPVELPWSGTVPLIDSRVTPR